MAIEIKLPALGENIDSATVAAILVSAGDNIADQQPIMEVDTEKAAIEVPASASGKIREVLVKPGDVIEVGQTLLTLEESAEAPAPSPPPRASSYRAPLATCPPTRRNAGSCPWR